MAKKIREQSLSLISYLSKVKDDDISDNQDVQRLFCWDNNAINELVMTVLTDDYIPPVILGEEEIDDGVVQQYIVDGMQRSSALIRFRYGNYKITSSVEDGKIRYQRKKRDKNNLVCKNEEGSVVWDTATFDMKGKTFDMLPEELKKRFDDYQIRIVIHQNCTMEQISKLVRRYNNHKAMNASQKAFTYIDNYARKIRAVSQCSFFKNCTAYSEKEKKKGTYEKIVCESVMTIYHLDKWKKQPKQMSIFLNQHSSEKEYDRVLSYASRIEKVCEDRFRSLFVLKDISVWLAVFDRFTKLGVEDAGFPEFMTDLMTKLHKKEVNGTTYDLLEKEGGTKDKKLITAKIQLLTTLMQDYFSNENAADQGTEADQETEAFVEDFRNTDFMYGQELSDREIQAAALAALSFVNDKDDVLFYADCANEWLLKVKNRQDTANQYVLPAVIGFVKHIYDIDETDECGVKALEKFLHYGVIKDSVQKNYNGMIACLK
ncbi:MAG: DUF262 domain-containing protein [Eubacterium sp.]|nr:DUF262 domain-containing protein [Eubacterium sp.]